jgi:uncharacterized damage-inducible protein DinB
VSPRPLALAAVALIAAITPDRLAAQATPTASGATLMDARSAAYLRDQYLADLDTLHAKIVALANAIPAEKYAWRPAAGVRSVSEALMHVAGEWYYYTPVSVGAKPPADFGVPREALPKLETITTKARVLAELDKSWAHCKAEVAGVDPATLTGKYRPWNASLATAAFAMAGDLHEHLGQLIAYARSVGVTPPWSK